MKKSDRVSKHQLPCEQRPVSVMDLGKDQTRDQRL